MLGIRAGRGVRRGVVAILAAAGALWHAPTIAKANDWKAAWEQTVAAAKKEGQLVISGPSGTAWREQLLTFQQDYPEIKLSITAAASRDFWPRIIKEREAKLSLWD